MHPDRLIVLGTSGVGKTSIIQQYAEESYVRTYTPTIEDVLTLVIKYPDGKSHAVEIIDTSGGNDYPAMRKLRIAQGHRFLVVYSVNELQTLHSAIRLCKMVYAVKDVQWVPMLLVGNKMDMASTRSVSTEMALAVCKEFKCPHVEGSAKINLNINCMFEIIMGLPDTAPITASNGDSSPISRSTTISGISRDFPFKSRLRLNTNAVELH